MINFISNLPSDLRTGGFSSANVASFMAIGQVAETRYVGPVDPPPLWRQKLASKLMRVAGLRGDFFFFSPQRLATIAAAVARGCAAVADLDFFHGFTPWIATRPARRYMAWSDCTFRDYVDVFHDRDRFERGDLARIEAHEAAWLKGATRVLFSSEWAARRAVAHYGLDPVRVGVTGIFGEMDEPAKDAYAGGKEFIFVSTNFAAKGGEAVVAAFREVRRRHPDAALTIIGDAPPRMIDLRGIDYAGFLRKEVAADKARLREIMGRARVLVHATKSDITPGVLVEAGYFGCPAIASNRVAIPELVAHGRDGFLLDDPTDPHAVAQAMLWMLDDEPRYRALRRAAWETSRARHSRARFSGRLQSHVRDVLSGA